MRCTDGKGIIARHRGPGKGAHRHQKPEDRLQPGVRLLYRGDPLLYRPGAGDLHTQADPGQLPNGISPRSSRSWRAGSWAPRIGSCALEYQLFTEIRTKVAARAAPHSDHGSGHRPAGRALLLRRGGGAKRVCPARRWICRGGSKSRTAATRWWRLCQDAPFVPNDTLAGQRRKPDRP